MTSNSHEIAELGWDKQEIEYVALAFEQVFHRLPSPLELECFGRVLARAASRAVRQP